MAKPETIPQIICADPALGHLLSQWLASQAIAGEVVCSPAICYHAPLCGCLKPVWLEPQGLVRHALLDAVATLERTRHAFKSRELADLRMRLEQLLKDLSAYEQ
ncbi:MAG: hypothetical protein VCA57_04290 [Pseudomonas sp.]|uniref:hypothetical protein n=1 Tax=Pseudomonas sp. TaxID=306 RepID=UPI0039826459